jgi:hypothetical protein
VDCSPRMKEVDGGREVVEAMGPAGKPVDQGAGGVTGLSRAAL